MQGTQFSNCVTVQIQSYLSLHSRCWLLPTPARLAPSLLRLTGAGPFRWPQLDRSSQSSSCLPPAGSFTLLLLASSLLLCKSTAPLPICPSGAVNCQVSLRDLFDRAVILSHYIHKLSSEMFSEFVSAIFLTSSRRNPSCEGQGYIAHFQQESGASCISNNTRCRQKQPSVNKMYQKKRTVSEISTILQKCNSFLNFF